MITEDQTRVIEFLSSPAAHGGEPVDRVETHASVVFLAGHRALKLKRAVRYDFLDFSTAERRRALSEAEVRLNRRTAPGLYRGVLAVTRERDGSLALDGPGAPVDWVIEMRRFPDDDLFDRLAAAGRLHLELMGPLAEAIARFHIQAAPRPDRGGADGMRWVVDGNAAACVDQGAGMLDRGACEAVATMAREAIARHAAPLDRRREGGLVRQCHGDLHLRNIVMLDGRPTLFDAIEFNDEIACIDVLYDLSFLLMDLWRRRLPRHANLVLNRYLAARPDDEGLTLLPLFLSCRAAVRAKTSAAGARLQADARRRDELVTLARGYLQMAADLLRPRGAALVAIGGLSGAGKSTLARALAPSLGAVPGARVLRSDEIRKRICKVPELERLGSEGYAPEVTRRVYDTLADRAGVLLAGGHAVIADAVFADPTHREAIAAAARSASVPFVGIWLDAPAAVLRHRLARRKIDASDADGAVLGMQLARDLGPIAWERLEASEGEEEVLRRGRSVLASRLPGRLADPSTHVS
jgi:aminoglycoside phosphotransferase family enzyme/predicted kinase